MNNIQKLGFSQGEIVRPSKTANVRIKRDPTRLRRRVGSKLDLLMGKVPKGLKSRNQETGFFGKNPVSWFRLLLVACQVK